MSLHLALDTTNGNLSCALWDNDHFYLNQFFETSRNVAEILAPIMETALDTYQLNASDITDIISVAGPGGFSAVRTGTSFLTGFSQVIDCPIQTLSSLEALALSVPIIAKKSIIISILNAKRSSVYIEVYDSNYNVLHQAQMIEKDSLKDFIQPFMHYTDIHISGHGAQDIISYFPQENISSVIAMTYAPLFGRRAHKISTQRDHAPIYLRDADAVIGKKKFTLPKAG